MTQFQFTILLVFSFLLLSNCSINHSTEKDLNNSTQTTIALKTPTDFLSQVKHTKSAEYTVGDSVLYVFGDLFKTNEKYALIVRQHQYEGAHYSCYRLLNNRWKMVINDTALTSESIVYRIEDFDFDGRLDLAVCDIFTINGNEFYNLYLNKKEAFTYSESFHNISNPHLDVSTHSIQDIYRAGNYDQHSKAIYKHRNGSYFMIEQVTIDPVWDTIHPENEVIAQKVCYYKERNGTLKLAFCKTANEDKSWVLFNALILFEFDYLTHDSSLFPYIRTH